MADEKVAVQVGVTVAGAPTLKSLKQEIKEAQNQALALSRQFGELSPQAVAAAARVAELRDEIADLNERVELADPGKKFAAFGNAVAGVASGFTAAQGALATFGAESKDLEKTLVKLQGAMALSEGLSGIADSWKDFQRLGNVIKTQVVKAFSTLKGAIIATGIGALIVALGLIVANFEEIDNWLKKVIPGFEGLGKMFDKLKAVAMGAIAVIIEDFKTLGTIIKDVLSGDFKGAAEAWKNSGKNAAAAFQKGFNDEMAAQEAETARETRKNLIASQDNQLKILRAGGAARVKEAEALELEIAKNKVKVADASTKEGLAAQTAAFADLEALRIQQSQQQGQRLLTELQNRQALQMQALEQAGKDTIGIQEKQLQAQLALEKKYGLDTAATVQAILQQREADRKARFDKELEALQKRQDLEAKAAEISGKNILHLKEDQLKVELDLYRKYGYSLKDIQDKQAQEELDRRQKLNDLLQKKVFDHEVAINIKLKNGVDQANQFAASSAEIVASKEAEKQRAYEITQKYLADVTDAVQESSELEQSAAIAGALAVQLSELAKQKSLEATGNIFETAGKILGKQTVAGKAVAVASATVNAIEGASKSFTSLAGIPIVGPALGAVAAGAALVAGYARVKSILKVKVPGASDSSSASLPSAPVATVPSASANTGALLGQAAQQNTTLQQPTRVFVLESDITDTQDRVAKIEANAQF